MSRPRVLSPSYTPYDADGTRFRGPSGTRSTLVWEQKYLLLNRIETIFLKENRCVFPIMPNTAFITSLRNRKMTTFLKYL